MSFYKAKYSKSAEKFIEKNKAIDIRFFKAFAGLAEDRENIQSYNIKKLHSKNYDDIFRLRIGGYRAVFRIVDDELLVYVFDIGPRDGQPLPSECLGRTHFYEVKYNVLYFTSSQ